MNTIKTIWCNLANLINFQGRETRSQFWPYAAFVVILSTVGTYAAMLPSMTESTEKFFRFATAHPEQTALLQGPEFFPNMAGMVAMTSIVDALNISLLAAAVCRRLHDHGKSAFWGLAPIPFMIVSSVMAPTLYGQFQEGTLDLRLFSALLLNSILFWAALIRLVILLCGESSSGENRFGPGPSIVAQEHFPKVRSI